VNRTLSVRVRSMREAGSFASAMTNSFETSRRAFAGLLVLIAAAVAACAQGPAPRVRNEERAALRDECPGEIGGILCHVVDRSGPDVTVTMWPARPARVTTRLRWTLENAVSLMPQEDIVLEPGTRTMVARIHVTGSPTSYFFAARATWGTPAAREDQTVYRLPWRAPLAFFCANGRNGTGAHVGDGRFAWDIVMPEGTEILAARGGLVFATEDRYSAAGNDPTLPSNYVFVAHEDGTYARYLHLRPGGVAVRIGERVQPGDLLGYSGNTGWSMGPHLHFDVMTAVDAERSTTLPVVAATSPTTTGDLVAGVTYRAF
jgi:hypothetical protein